MSETLRDLVVSLSLNSDNFTRNIKSINKQIQEAESAFKLASAGVEGFERTTEGLSSRLSTLQRTLGLQKDAVTQYQRALEQANSKLTECYGRQSDYTTRLGEAKQKQAQLKDEVAKAAAKHKEYAKTLGESDSATIASKANLDALKGEYKDATAEVKKLSGQKVALTKATQNAADAVSTAQTKFNGAQAAIKATSAEIEKCTSALRLSQTSWDAAGQTIVNSEQAVASIGKQMKAAESQYKLAAAGVKDFDKSTEGLTAKLTLLQDKLELQQKAVAEYQKQLRAAKEQLQAAQSVGDDEKIRQATDAVTDAGTALNNARAAVKQTQADIASCNKELKTAESLWTAAGKSLESFGKTCGMVSKNMVKAGKVLTTTLTAPIIALGTTAIKASIEYESAFTSVRKTVDAAEEEFASLSSSIKEMSTQVATSASDIAEVTAVAGQLGIQNEHLMEFTRTMIDLGNSTDIVANQAASTLAKFANIMNMDQSLFENLGSTLVDLGNNYATTESAIMQMSMRLAGAGHQVGLSESQILGFATALSAVGIEAQMGGSAFSKALIKMEVASATGGEALKDFGKVAGITAEQFKTLFDADPAAAFQAFIVGLSKLDDEGESAIATLEDIGIKEVRLRDTMLRATNATELFANTQITANAAWKKNTALADEASKRYNTTESKLKNLKNTAMLFAQQIGDDLNPTIQNLIGGANDLLAKFMQLDESQRMQIIKFAAIAAAAGPVLLILGKLTKGIGVVSTNIGKFATAVGKADGGFSGFMSVLSKSPAVWMAVAAAVVVGVVALADYVSGAKQAREALEGMAETAKKWKDTAAETFYGKSDGLSFFGMSDADFTRDKQTAEEWLSGLLTVWSDGKTETKQIVTEWTESFKNLTATTRDELTALKETADQAGYTSVSDQLAADIAKLDAMDAEIGKLLKKRQSKNFTEKDKIRLQELIDAREAIEIKYKLSPADADGFETIAQKVEAEVARAQAKNKPDADVSVYENAMVAAAQGMAAVNSELDAQYDKEFALIQLIKDGAERQTALDALNNKYNADRLASAREYAQTLAGVVMPVWEQADIQQAGADIDTIIQKLGEYSAAAQSDKPALLEELNQLTAGMDESAITEYIGLLTQVQSLMDSGMSEEEVNAMFPELDFSASLEQIAAIQNFLKDRKTLLPGMAGMFGEALPEEILKITTDLDMTGAQARWDEFAANPGAITTEAIIAGFADGENAVPVQPVVTALISSYTEIPEGASTATLTPTGLLAYVSKYAEVTAGADVSGLTPENVTAMVSAYQELAKGADVSTLKPSEITAYISSYLKDAGVDMSGITPNNLTAFVLAYEEVEGGALTTSLQPTDIAAIITEYLQSENVDLSKLTEPQIDALVNAYSEATGCDKTKLKAEVVAQITAYEEAEGVQKPAFISTQISITGYDLTAYRQFVAEHPVEVDGVVRLNNVYQNPRDALNDPNTTFWKDGVEIPTTMVPTEMLTPDTVAVLDADGTMHILLTPDLTGSAEAIAALRQEVEETDQLGVTNAGKAIGLQSVTLLDMVDSAIERVKTFNEQKGTFWQLWGLLEDGAKNTLDTSMQLDFNPDALAGLSTYVSEVVTAIKNGEQVGEADLNNLKAIVEFLNGLELTGVGENVTAGIGDAMTAAGWEADAESVAQNLENALNAALIIQSPSQRMKPVGANVAAGVGEGMSGYDLSPQATVLASSIENAVVTALTAKVFMSAATTAMGGLSSALTAYSMASTGATVGQNTKSAVAASLNSSTLRPIAMNAMAGLTAGINAGRWGVIVAMRSAARAAVNAAKAELKIQSPSAAFRDEVGRMAIKGLGQGALLESRKQAGAIRNAARYLTGEAKDGAIGYASNDNRRTYNQSVSSTIQVAQMVVRDEQDIRSLAVEIATLTKRQQRGKGLRMA